MSARKVIDLVDVMESVSLGGASRAAIAVAKHTARYARDHAELRYRFISLKPPDLRAVKLASEAGIEVLHGLDRHAIDELLGAADIVQVHFWNNPAIYEFLGERLPPFRLVLICHICGNSAPHLLPAKLGHYADMFIAITPITLELDSLKEITKNGYSTKTTLIRGNADLDRMRGVKPVPHETFNIGYIGTVDFAKMHRSFIRLHADLDIPNLRIIVCGDGNAKPILMREAEDLGIREQFEFLGYQEDIRDIVSRLDVFGYPLAPDNYSASELVIQEVMSVGVVPVVLPYGGAARIIEDGVSGVVASDTTAYRHALRQLYKKPPLRHQLSAGARNAARHKSGAANSAARFYELYRSLIKVKPKPKPGLWEHKVQSANRFDTGSSRFIFSLADAASAFRSSRDGTNIEDTLDAEVHIFHSQAALSSASGGGILHYRSHYPKDPWLRLWAGLVLEAHGQNALALAEYHTAIRRELDHWRVHAYLARAAVRINANDLAAVSLERVNRDAPSYLQRILNSPPH
ncbi:MAG: hypothetical protein DHS20C01_33050 [marine bacterium B5-7]|nr:MAG: hypothetical protein DHS20C01_33050 [marine bacterium B5-7]